MRQCDMTTPRAHKIVFVIAVGIFVLGVSAYLFFPVFPGEDKHKPLPLENKDQVQETQQVQENSQEYHNKARGFSLRYPAELSIKEHDEGDGTYTIVFEDTAGEKSFQIFFTPYMGNTITQSRIVKDVPSGKFSAPVDIVVGGGTPALMFFSEGSLGRLREVWFLGGGFLYEITAHVHLDEWLSRIMSTWEFF